MMSVTKSGKGKILLPKSVKHRFFPLIAGSGYYFSKQLRYPPLFCHKLPETFLSLVADARLS